MTIYFAERGQCIVCYDENVETYVLCSCIVHKMCTDCWRAWLIVHCDEADQNSCPRCHDNFPLIENTYTATLPVFVLWVLSGCFNVLTGEFLRSIDKPCTIICLSIFPFGAMLSALHVLYISMVCYVPTRMLWLHIVSIFGTLCVADCFAGSTNQLFVIMYIGMVTVIYGPVMKLAMTRWSQTHIGNDVIDITEINKILLLP
jgi:hypothetical protein